MNTYGGKMQDLIEGLEKETQKRYDAGVFNAENYCT
jgi:hypothetical protein